jgi:hypothetical protein
MSKKGPAWERQVATDISLWWSDGLRDDLTWRTAGSGARATVRGRKGKKTTNHCGDIGYTDVSIKPLFDFCVLELKRGYSSNSVQDILDAPIKKPVMQEYQKWVDQARESARNAESVTWMIIFKRDRREPIVIMEEHRMRSVDMPDDYIILNLSQKHEKIILMKLSEWFKIFTPEKIKGRIC